MVQILPEIPSFGSQFARALGGGLSQGIASAGDVASKLMMEKASLDRKRKFIESFDKTAPKQTFSSLYEEDTEPKEFKDQIQTSSTGWSSKMQQAKAAELVGETGIANILREEAKFEREQEELPKKEYVKAQYKSLPKFLENISETEDRLPTIDTSLKMIEDAIERGEDALGTRERLADITGIEGFRTASGAELQSAIKNYFLGDLTQIKGGRPNQLIERQLLDAYPKMGRDPIANQKIVAGMKMQRDIANEKVRLTRDLEEKYLAKVGHLPPDFESIVKKKLKPIATEIEKKTIKTMENLNKFQREYQRMASKNLKKGETLMLTPDGEYLAIPKEQYSEAKEEGYIKVS